MPTLYCSTHRLQVTRYRKTIRYYKIKISYLKSLQNDPYFHQDPYLQFNHIRSYRNFIAHYTNLVNFHMDRLDVLSGC